MNDNQLYVEIVEPDIEDSMRLPEVYRSDEYGLKEGFELERFVDTPRKDFQCPVCFGVVRDPLECVQCGMLICKKCANDVFNTNRLPDHPGFPRKMRLTCPVCRSKAIPREPSLLLTKYINSLKIKCKNRLYGCEEIFPLDAIKTHQKACKFSMTSCANSQFCNKKGSKNEFINVSFPKPRKASYFIRRIPKKDKSVCSEACKKLLLMKHILENDQKLEALQMFHSALVDFSN